MQQNVYKKFHHTLKSHQLVHYLSAGFMLKVTNINNMF